MNRQDLKKLQKEWYQKLKETGFVDAEDLNGCLKQGSAMPIRGKVRPIEDTIKYYQSAQSVLHGYKFSSSRDKLIWSLHCMGLSTRQIAHRIGRIDHCTVFQAIKRISVVILDTSDVTCINLINIRDGKVSDEDLIYSTWIRPLYHDSDENSDIDRDVFVKATRKRIASILSRPSVSIKIACLNDDPDVIIGYSVIEWRKLWWVYVKKAWREMGIAKRLIPDSVNSCGPLTRRGKYLKPSNWLVDPYFKEEVE